jgi:hypothetical protein
LRRQSGTRVRVGRAPRAFADRELPPPTRTIADRRVGCELVGLAAIERRGVLGGEMNPAHNRSAAAARRARASRVGRASLGRGNVERAGKARQRVRHAFGERRRRLERLAAVERRGVLVIHVAEERRLEIGRRLAGRRAAAGARIIRKPAPPARNNAAKPAGAERGLADVHRAMRKAALEAELAAAGLHIGLDDELRGAAGGGLARDHFQHRPAERPADRRRRDVGRKVRRVDRLARDAGEERGRVPGQP